MPISEEVLAQYVAATSALIHQFGFYEAFALVIKELEVPVGIDERELKSKVGFELNRMKNEQRKLRDPIQLVRAHEGGIIFTINKNTEVAFMPKGHRTVLQNVRWVGESKKPAEVEVDGRIMTTAYNRACKHFRDLRKAQGLGRKKRVHGADVR
jgi:hypothetical protein